MVKIVRQYAQIKEVEVVIANGTSLSAVAVLPPAEYMCGIEMPAAWTTANLTFQVSHDGVTYMNLYDQAGTELTVTAAASRYIILNPEDFWGFAFVKVRSGTAGSAVNQGAARTISLKTRPL